MTLPDQIVDELLEQHEALRDLMDSCEQLADTVDAAGGDLGRLVHAVAKLRLAFDAHNKYEEHVLPTILRDYGTVGPARIEYLTSDHAVEHRALRHRLDGPTHELRATLYELRAHLALEERLFQPSPGPKAEPPVMSTPGCAR